MTTEKRPVGRPRTTTDDLPSGWQKIMLDCGAEGGSAVECRVLLGIAQTAWETLLEDSEEFRVTEKERQDLCQIWWDKQGRRMTQDGQGSAAVWVFNMKNRFGWRDKQEVEQTVTGKHEHTHTVDSVDKFAEILKDYSGTTDSE